MVCIHMVVQELAHGEELTSARGDAAIAGDSPPSTKSEPHQNFPLEEGSDHLIFLLIKAALRSDQIEDQDKIVDLLRFCRYDHHADQINSCMVPADAKPSVDAE